MKGEIKDKLKDAKTSEEVKVIIDDYMDYYNNDRSMAAGKAVTE